MTQYQNLLTLARETIPGFKIKYKSKTGLWRLLPKKLRRASTYLHLSRTCWLPEQSDEPVQLRRLAHEYIHAFDAITDYTKYLAKYLFPQWLSIPILLTAGVAVLFDGVPPQWLLLAIIPLLPLPAPFRAELEQRGYTATLYAYYLQYGHIPSTLYLSCVENMRSWMYYGMCNRSKANQLMSDAMALIEDGGPQGTPYEHIRQSIRGNPEEREGDNATT